MGEDFFSGDSPEQDLSCNGNRRFDSITEKKSSGPAANGAIDGRALLGFSLTSPDLVICAGSPEIRSTNFGDSPGFSDMDLCPMEVSLENGIDGSDTNDALKRPSVKFATVCETFERELSPESSFELFAQPEGDDKAANEPVSVISVNAGSIDGHGAVVLGRVEFSKDGFFTAGDTLRTDAVIGDGEGHCLYQTARFGDFSYHFPALDPGSYVVSLHLAEIVFTDGPPGLRVFNVYIQDKMAVSSLDIYNQVGANKPLVISNLKTSVDGDEGLTIRFEGVMGSPIVCGISVAKQSPYNLVEAEEVKSISKSQVLECDIPEDDVGEADVDYQKLLRDYQHQKRELIEVKKKLEDLERENKLKSREYQDACGSLQELQNELMRKSMHVGSLAFAIEGQVKEKSRWNTLLRNLTRKLKIIKMDQIKLLEEAHTYKNYVKDMADVNHTILSKLKQHVDSHEDLKIKFAEGEKERKRLYNKVLDLKGSIRVFCRCRPLNSEELAEGALMALDFESAKEGELTTVSNGLPRKTFKFDAVFDPQADQANVFEDTGPFAMSVLDGYNVCIFAYGQTGTGKTFTMEGTENARGVNYRILEEMFNIITKREKLFHYDISVSALEVYNEQIRDLLVSGSQEGMAAKRLEIRQVGEGYHVPGLVEANVNNMNEVWEVLQTGSNARAVGSTNANEHSSRSHCLHCVMVKGENLLTGECTRSKLWLVDLAGSERIAKTEVQGERLKETQSINKSLSALGDVISALATKSPHIPFRNSKLTHLLQDSLGGDSKTLMIVQISPADTDMGETLCSLNFASRVKGIELGPAKRHFDTSELQKYKLMTEKSKQDLKYKDAQIKKMEETIHGMELKIKEKEQKNRTLQEKIKELESELLVERKLARQHVYSKIAEQHQMNQSGATRARSPLANRQLGVIKNLNEELEKEQTNFNQILVENNEGNSIVPTPPVQGMVKTIDTAEKENNPEMVEQLLPKRTGRASICTIARQISAAPAPRRTSLIPLPTLTHPCQPIPATLPLQHQTVIHEDTENTEDKQTHCNSPKGTRSGSKKLTTILRRSLQKKVQLKRSPIQQYLRKGGINAGTDRVRVSIGSRGRMTYRAVPANGMRGGMQQKQSQREKERGWNIGTGGKNVI